MNSIFGIILYAEKLNGESFSPREWTRQKFIVEDCSEDDCGQWDTDETTGEQGNINAEKSCFWTWDDNECAWQSRPLKSRQFKRRNGKGKGKDKSRSKRTGRAFFGEEQSQDSELWSEEDFAWSSMVDVFETGNVPILFSLP